MKTYRIDVYLKKEGWTVQIKNGRKFVLHEEGGNLVTLLKRANRHIQREK